MRAPTLCAVTLAGVVAAGQAANDSLAVTVRLTTAVSTASSQAGDPVSALVLGRAGVAAGLPPACVVTGHVTEAVNHERAYGGRAMLRLTFDGVRDATGATHPARLQVVAVDNAREEVNADGDIVGLAPVHARPTGVEALVLLAAHAHPMALVASEAVRLGVKLVARPDIAYEPGVHLTLTVAPDPALGSLDCDGPGTVEMPADAATLAWVARLPTRAEAGMPPRDADWINVVVVGSRAVVDAGFAKAGWVTADRTSLRADARTFLSVVEHEGYLTGPVSLLTLGGRAPAMVFQNQTDTFAKRHHIRLWPAPPLVPGGPEAWVAAATHDIGLEFSHRTRHYTHRIDGAIDDERERVLVDLVGARALRRFSLVPRPGVPRQSTNATGDRVTTDGRVVVVTFVDAATAAAHGEAAPDAKGGRRP